MAIGAKVNIQQDQPVTDAQLRASRVNVNAEDISGRIPTKVKNAEISYQTVLDSSNPTFTWDMLHFQSFHFSVNNFGQSANCVLRVDTSLDGRNWINVAVENIGNTPYNTGSNNIYKGFAQSATPPVWTQPTYGPSIYAGGRYGRFMRITLSNVSTFVPVELVIRLSAAPYVQRINGPETTWEYPYTEIAQATGTLVNTKRIITLQSKLSSPPFQLAISSWIVANSGTQPVDYIIQNETGTILWQEALSVGEKVSRTIVLYAGKAQNIQLALPDYSDLKVRFYIKGFYSLVL